MLITKRRRRVLDEIERSGPLSGRDVAAMPGIWSGRVYVLLGRMEQAGLLRSELVDQAGCSYPRRMFSVVK